jgi:ACS family D-galactonate transporter-like MFS transporter
MQAYGWRTMFVVFGAITVIWLLPWLPLTARLRDGHAASGAAGVSFAVLLRQRALWALALC